MEISSKTNDDEPKPDKGTACIKSAIVRRLSEIENYFNTTNDTNLVCGIFSDFRKSRKVYFQI